MRQDKLYNLIEFFIEQPRQKRTKLNNLILMIEESLSYQRKIKLKKIKNNLVN